MQPLLDDDHCPFGGLVEAGHERPLEPVVDRVAGRLGGGFRGLEGIVDDDEMRALAGRRTLHGRRQAVALGVRAHFRQRGAPLVDLHSRKDRLVVGRPEEVAETVGKVLGQLIAVGRADDLPRRVSPEDPGRQRDRSENALAVAGRDRDQQAAGFPGPDFFQRARQDAKMRGGGKARLRRERRKTSR